VGCLVMLARVDGTNGAEVALGKPGVQN
jgi:hypothetical protein